MSAHASCMPLTARAVAIESQWRYKRRLGCHGLVRNGTRTIESWVLHLQDVLGKETMNFI